MRKEKLETWPFRPGVRTLWQIGHGIVKISKTHIYRFKNKCLSAIKNRKHCRGGEH